MCSKEGKVTLLNTFVNFSTRIYYEQNVEGESLRVFQYYNGNDAFRILLKLPRYCCTSAVFAEVEIPDYSND